MFDPSGGMKRCIIWFVIFSSTDGFQHDVLVTGGEDSKIVTWRVETPDLSTLSQLGDPMGSEMSNLKRECDDTMDDNQADAVSNPHSATKNFHRPSFLGEQAGEAVASTHSSDNSSTPCLDLTIANNRIPIMLHVRTASLLL